MSRGSPADRLDGFLPPLRSIRVRLTLWYLAVFGLVLVAFAVVVYVAVTEQTELKVDGYIQAQITQLAATYDTRDGLLHPSTPSSLAQNPADSGRIVLLLTPTDQVKQAFGPLTDAAVTQLIDFVRTNPSNGVPPGIHMLSLTLTIPGERAVNEYVL